MCTNSANISKAFRSLPRENRFFFCCLSFKVLWEKPEVVYLKNALNFQINVLGLTYLQVGQVLLISYLAMISFTPQNEHEKAKNVKLRMNLAKVSPSVTRRGKDSTLLLNPVRFLNYVFSSSMFSS